MDHNEIRHKLSEYIDGAVSPQERAAIDEHLKTCMDCPDALTELRKTIEHIHAVEEVESPTWMTQKIMANVRAEQKAKQSFWQRIFVPLLTKFPVQAAAVLFLSVTAFYIYTTTHPADKYAEAPMGRLAKQEAPAEMQDTVKSKSVEVPVKQEKKVAQEPGYKSLDMKYEYEKPAPPVPVEAPAAAAKRATTQPGLSEASREERPAAPRAAAPSMMADQAVPSGAARSSVAADEENNKLRIAGSSQSELSGKKEPSGAVDRSDAEAEQVNAVTEYFVHKDLPAAMKVKGLSFTTYKYHDGLPGLQWIQGTMAFKRSPCNNRYLVDVVLSARSLKYLYCYDTPRIKRIGVYELANGVWSEKK